MFCPACSNKIPVWQQGLTSEGKAIFFLASSKQNFLFTTKNSVKNFCIAAMVKTETRYTPLPPPPKKLVSSVFLLWKSFCVSDQKGGVVVLKSALAQSWKNREREKDHFCHNRLTLFCRKRIKPFLFCGGGGGEVLSFSSANKRWRGWNHKSEEKRGSGKEGEPRALNCNTGSVRPRIIRQRYLLWQGGKKFLTYFFK